MELQKTKMPSFKLDDAAFALVALFILSNTFTFVSSLKQIPSPLYGGDFYNGLGGVVHILDGGNVLDSAQMAGQVPWVPWFYHLSVAAFSKIPGLGAIPALLNFSIIIDALALAVLYLLVKNYGGNGYLAAAVALAVFSLGHSPVFKYSGFSLLLMVPSFALALYSFAKEPNIRKAALAGILLGLVGLSNTQAFFVGFSLLFFTYAVFCLLKIFDVKKMSMKLDAPSLEEAKLYGIIFAIGFALSLLFWFRPIFIYHGSTPNDIQNITTPDITKPYYLWSSIQNLVMLLLFPFGLGGAMALFSLVSLAGIYAIAKEHSRPEAKFALALLLLWIALIFHPLITMPLLHMNMVNFMLSDQIYPLAFVTTCTLGFCFAEKKLRERHQYLPYALLALLFISSLFAYLDFRKVLEENQWTAVGRTQLAMPYLELSDYIRNGTDVNDVFITTNEDGFMMNALSGRKVVSYRRSHSSPYVDVSERMGDQAVVVYGTDGERTKALLDKYGVKYLLLTGNWVQNEFQFDSDGKLAGFFDPLTVPSNASNMVYWGSSGVRYLEENFSMDPAPRTGVPKYAQLVALPYAFNASDPLSPQAYGNFELVKEIGGGNGNWLFRMYERK